MAVFAFSDAFGAITNTEPSTSPATRRLLSFRINVEVVTLVSISNSFRKRRTCPATLRAHHLRIESFPAYAPFHPDLVAFGRYRQKGELV